MNNDLKSLLSKILNESITKVSPVHGGDISKAFKIETSNNAYFLKSNNVSNASNMFQIEAYGLQVIRKTNTIKTPKVLACDTFQNVAFLLMEFIDSKSPSSVDYKNLGYQLAQLHQCTSDSFGLDQDNFIGSLPQSNRQNTTWVDFYTTERLLPQLELAKQKQLLSKNECPSIQNIKSTLESLFTNIKPALLHGDLWSGNYLISKDGTPYLIDPAIYYGHHEVDIAMTKLFGGFDTSFYETYSSLFKNDENTSTRIEIYQLYYLLVHLNLFGRSYYGSVSSILKKYF
ncbi:fructosamine kinase family protein [Flavivirga abyssicola]|uniref:fructosamine kinase family protein n=1 Tax=Flavivirga abyssicola TaxID=3063533 RepID=UPI0026DFDF9D|nr:fructosamine kinase family protein [Flavivirga sp. MEBiC07777]WVK12166.1 fructosamine kinase family protein [Flavivirga sp. MEBiC07777]